MPRPSRTALVLRLVAEVPPRRATTYGLLAEAVEEMTGTPMPALAAGRALRENDGTLAWWRVIRSDGSIAEHMEPETHVRWRDEGLPLRRRGDRLCVDLDACLWDPVTDSPLVAAVGSGDATWEAACEEPWGPIVQEQLLHAADRGHRA